MDSIGRRGGRGPRTSGLWRLKHGVLDATHNLFWAPGGSPIEPNCGPARRNFRAEGALSSRCITTDYSPMVLECPRDAHRGRSERYPDPLPTHKVALNRHEPATWIVLVGEGAVDRGGRAYGGSNTPCLTPQTSSFGLPPGAQSSPTAGPLEGIFAPKAHFHPGVSPPTTVQWFWSVRKTLTGAARSDIHTLYRHTKLL